MDGITSSEDRMWAAAAHLIAMLAGYLVPVVGNIAGPLVIYFINKDRSKFVAFHALQATFWACLCMVAGLVIGIIGLVLAFTIILLPLAGLLIGVIAIVGLVISIMAAIKAYNGELYEYPIVGKIARDMVGV
ncbi:MAG TPA: DUF4870 domain-containing protein [Armatimonadota bacterium]|jgi:hypothetical protein